MLTRNRREFVPGAIACFLAQDWPNKELIIIDDGHDRVFDLVPDGGQVRYYHLQDRRSIGQKRNIGASRSEGEIICHWDDDDHFAPGRITDQVTRLGDGNLTGYNRITFADDDLCRAWEYIGAKDYAVGTSLCYRRDYWMTHPFIDVNQGEDNNMVYRAGKISVADGRQMIVARVHGGNTCDRRAMLTGQKWTGAQLENWKEIDYSGLADYGYPVKGLSVAAA